MTLAEQAQLAGLLEQHGCWLLENDIHGGLEFEACAGYLRDLVNPERLMVFLPSRNSWARKRPMVTCCRGT